MCRPYPLALGDLERRPDREETEPAPPIVDATALRGGGRDTPGAAALAELVAASAQLARRASALKRELESRGALSGSRCEVLRELDQGGPQTVPQLARTRSVTRQHVQAQVNALAEWGLVELINNPAHKRSRLVRLTSAGRESVAELERRAFDRLGRLETSMGLTEVRAAIAVIRAVAAAPESDD